MCAARRRCRTTLLTQISRVCTQRIWVLIMCCTALAYTMYQATVIRCFGSVGEGRDVQGAKNALRRAQVRKS